LRRNPLEQITITRRHPLERAPSVTAVVVRNGPARLREVVSACRRASGKASDGELAVLQGLWVYN
jgi:hypothetical protein